MGILDRIFGKKKAKKEPLVEDKGLPLVELTSPIPKVKPPLTEGTWNGGNGHVKKSGVRKKPNSPPPSPTAKKKPKKTTKKRSVKKMAGEIVYEYVQCDCEDWKNFLPQIAEQQQLAQKHGKPYTGKPFVYCPWCGYKRYRSNRGKKASK
jgi:hypothetical protein